MTRVDESHAGQTIRETVGESVELSLGEKPTTGHLWELVSGGDPVCALLESSFSPASRQPGAGGVRRWTFLVGQPGDADIVLVYRRPWAVREPPAREFRIRVRGLPSPAHSRGASERG